MAINQNLERLLNINIEGSAKVVKKKTAAFQALYQALTDDKYLTAFTQNRRPETKVDSDLTDDEKAAVVNEKKVFIMKNTTSSGASIYKIGHCDSNGEYAEEEINPQARFQENNSLHISMLDEDISRLNDPSTNMEQINFTLKRISTTLFVWKSQSWVAGNASELYMDFAHSKALCHELDSHQEILGIHAKDTGFFQTFTKEDFNLLRSDVAQKYAKILLNKAEIQPGPDLSKLQPLQKYIERELDIVSNNVEHNQTTKLDLVNELQILLSKKEDLERQLKKAETNQDQAEKEYKDALKTDETDKALLCMLISYTESLKSGLSPEEKGKKIQEITNFLVNARRANNNFRYSLLSLRDAEYHTELTKRISTRFQKTLINMKKNMVQRRNVVLELTTVLEQLKLRENQLNSEITQASSCERDLKPSVENTAISTILQAQQQLDEAQASLKTEANTAPPEQARLTQTINNYQDKHKAFYDLIEEYNADKDNASKIIIPPPKKPKAIRELSTGVKIEANIKGLVGKCPRDWTGELLTDITRINELDAMAPNHAGPSVSSAEAPPSKGMSLEKDERYIMRRTFQDPSTSAQLGVGMLIQEPNGTVVNHSKNLASPHEQQLVAIQMAQMFVRNYSPPTAIKIQGTPEDKQMAKMLHAAIKKILPKATINNLVPGGEPSFFENPLSDTKELINDVVKEMKAEVEQAQNKFNELAQAQKNLNNAVKGGFWGFGKKKTDTEVDQYRQLTNEARKKYESTGIVEGEENHPQTTTKQQ